MVTGRFPFEIQSIGVILDFMPISFEYDPESNILVEVGRGPISADEYFRHQLEMMRIKRKPGLRVLADYRNIEADPTFEEIMEGAAKTIELSEGLDVKISVVVGNDSLHHVLARLYSQLAQKDSTIEYEIFFDDVIGAHKWLGMDV